MNNVGDYKVGSNCRLSYLSQRTRGAGGRRGKRRHEGGEGVDEGNECLQLENECDTRCVCPVVLSVPVVPVGKMGREVDAKNDPVPMTSRSTCPSNE